MRRHTSILVAGAINTDLVATMTRAPEAGETITGKSFAMHGGGKGANQAVAVSRSGARAALLGAVGNDEFGHARLRDLKEDRIDVDGVLTMSGQSSGVALILVETGGENRIAYVPGATMKVGLEHALATLNQCAPEFVLATNELPGEVLEELFARAQDIGATVVFNATPDPERSLGLLRHVSLLVVNQGEGLALAERDSGDPASIARELAERHGCSVVMTLGADGVVAVRDGNLVTVAAHQVEAVDTTGAGDTFCGAFVAELAGGSDMRDAIAFGVAAAALSVTKAGAQSSIPLREEVGRFIE